MKLARPLRIPSPATSPPGQHRLAARPGRSARHRHYRFIESEALALRLRLHRGPSMQVIMSENRQPEITPRR